VWAGRSAALLPRAEAWGTVCTAITGLLISPISWTHHWVWCVPVAVLLCVESRVWCAAAVLVFWSFVPWRLPHAPAAALHLSPPAVVVSGWYVLFGLAFLGLAARRARARPVLTAAG
jgi:alpha-1,2-mannosyltransferase